MEGNPLEANLTLRENARRNRTAGVHPAPAGPTVGSDSIHLQALIPGKGAIMLLALNCPDEPATAAVNLPQGWRLNAQVDAYGKSHHEQPQCEMIRLGPLLFCDFCGQGCESR